MGYLGYGILNTGYAIQDMGHGIRDMGNEIWVALRGMRFGIWDIWGMEY